MTKSRKSTESSEEALIGTSLRLTRAQHDALKALAAREHRSFSQQLRHMIEERVADADHREAA
jgi:hypothetical protein